MTRRQERRKAWSETAAFLAAATVIAVLLAWWGVFARRLIIHVRDLDSELARATIPEGPARAQALADATSRASRHLVMISWEGSAFAALLLVCVCALFLVARGRRRAGERLERLLQFTAHELKTPIAGVKALLQSLQIGTIPEARRAELLEQGLLETARLEHLVETHLAYRRVSARPAPARRPASARDLVSDVLEHRRRTMGAEPILRADPPPDATVLADADSVRVILENLLDNARKHGGGDIQVIEQPAACGWRIVVADCGVGLEPGQAERIFEPFERDARGATHGSGLGLHISRQLARALGGDLRAESDGPGRGTRFILELPLATGSRPT